MTQPKRWSKFEDAAAHFSHGLRYLQAERHEEAVKAFTEAIGMYPQFEGAYRYRAEAFRSLGRVPEANKDLDTVVSISRSRIQEAEQSLGGQPLQRFIRETQTIPRWLIAVVSGLGVLVLGAILVLVLPGQGDGDSETQAPTSAGSESALAGAAIPKAVPITEPTVFVGRGDSLTSVANFSPAIVLLTIQHRGGSDFVVDLVAETGESFPSVNTVGPYTGTRAHLVDPGQPGSLSPGPHRLNVRAGGSWQIELGEPRWEDGSRPPFSWSSKGDNVAGPILLRPGTTLAQFTHSGSSDFVAELLKSDGTGSRVLVDEIGGYDGTVTLEIGEGIAAGLTQGIYAVAVRADGGWTEVVSFV